MMHRVPPLLIGAPFEEREFGDPRETEVVWREELLSLGDVETQLTENMSRRGRSSTHEQDQVLAPCATFLHDTNENVEFYRPRRALRRSLDTALAVAEAGDLLGGHADPYQSARAELLRL